MLCTIFHKNTGKELDFSGQTVPKKPQHCHICTKGEKQQVQIKLYPYGSFASILRIQANFITVDLTIDQQRWHLPIIILFYSKSLCRYFCRFLVSVSHVLLCSHWCPGSSPRRFLKWRLIRRKPWVRG